MTWPAWADGWTPPVEREHTLLAPQGVAGLAALLDADPSVTAIGAPLPALWHWVALAAWPSMAEVGADGHPTTGSFMPPTPYPRRMWLGCSIEVIGSPLVGDEVAVERTVTSIEEKSGSAGPFALIEVTTTIGTPAGESLVVERTRFAYRATTRVAPVAVDAEIADVTGRWITKGDAGWSVRPDPVVLARYSALTANGHRIHYDLPYATQVEGYPGLLVHGPLMATLLAEVVRRENEDPTIATFACRAQRPYFLGSTATITATTGDDGSVSLELRDNGAPANAPSCMTATVTLR